VGALVRAAVTIGDHVVIGASSFVNRDIPSWTVAVGVPCRPIGRVERRDGGYQLVYDKRIARP
jgi:acetyltransferase-like isoleucine patch superfamily enzyme